MGANGGVHFLGVEIMLRDCGHCRRYVVAFLVGFLLYDFGMHEMMPYSLCFVACSVLLLHFMDRSSAQI